MCEYANHLLHMCNHVLIPPKIILPSSCLFLLMVSPRCMNTLHLLIPCIIGDKVGDRVSTGTLQVKEVFCRTVHADFRSAIEFGMRNLVYEIYAVKFGYNTLPFAMLKWHIVTSSSEGPREA